MYRAVRLNGKTAKQSVSTMPVNSLNFKLYDRTAESSFLSKFKMSINGESFAVQRV